MQTLHTRFTLGREPLDDPFHVDIIKEKLMRSLTAVLPDVIDELRAAVPDYIHTEDNGTCKTRVSHQKTTLNAAIHRVDDCQRDTDYIEDRFPC